MGDSLRRYNDGWLKHKEKGKKYDTYWFVLKGRVNSSAQLESASLFCFRDQNTRDKKKFVGSHCIDIDGGVTLLKSETSNQKSKFDFTILLNNTKFHFRAESDIVRQQWIYALCDLVGKKFPPSDLPGLTNSIRHVELTKKKSSSIRISGSLRKAGKNEENNNSTSKERKRSTVTEKPSVAWFHAGMLRGAAEDLLQHEAAGCFLLRDSETFAGNFTLTFKDISKIKNHMITPVGGGRYKFDDEKMDEVFESPVEAVWFYMNAKKSQEFIPKPYGVSSRSVPPTESYLKDICTANERVFPSFTPSNDSKKGADNSYLESSDINIVNDTERKDDNSYLDSSLINTALDLQGTKKKESVSSMGSNNGYLTLNTDDDYVVMGPEKDLLPDSTEPNKDYVEMGPDQRLQDSMEQNLADRQLDDKYINTSPIDTPPSTNPPSNQANDNQRPCPDASFERPEETPQQEGGELTAKQLEEMNYIVMGASSSTSENRTSDTATPRLPSRQPSKMALQKTKSLKDNPDLQPAEPNRLAKVLNAETLSKSISEKRTNPLSKKFTKSTRGAIPSAGARSPDAQHHKYMNMGVQEEQDQPQAPPRLTNPRKSLTPQTIISPIPGGYVDKGCRRQDDSGNRQVWRVPSMERRRLLVRNTWSVR